MPREDRATWKSNYFMKIIVSLKKETQSCVGIACIYFCLKFLSLATCSNFWMTFPNASSSGQTMWGPSKCRPSVCPSVARLLCSWAKTPWCAKPSVATWKTILPWRSEYVVLALLQSRLLCTAGLVTVRLVWCCVVVPPANSNLFPAIPVCLKLIWQPGTQGLRHPLTFIYVLLRCSV